MTTNPKPTEAYSCHKFTTYICRDLRKIYMEKSVYFVISFSDFNLSKHQFEHLHGQIFGIYIYKRMLMKL